MELAAILGMVAVVCTLAVLQYRWTAEIGRSEQQRLKGTLTTDVRGFAQEFSYDFERLCETHEVDPQDPAENLEARVIRQHQEWTRIASRPDLLAGLMIWKTGAPHPTLESLDPNGKRFVELAWPRQ